jgi:hypothetical protein
MPRCKPPSAAPNSSSRPRRRRLVRRPPRLRLRPDDLRRHPRRRPRPVPARRAWSTDAAQLLRLFQDDLASELVRSMTNSSAIVITDGKVDGRNVWTGSSIPRRWPECIEQNARRPAREPSISSSSAGTSRRADGSLCVCVNHPLMPNVMGRGDALTFGQRHFMQGGSGLGPRRLHGAAIPDRRLLNILSGRRRRESGVVLRAARAVDAVTRVARDALTERACWRRVGLPWVAGVSRKRRSAAEVQDRFRGVEVVGE